MCVFLVILFSSYKLTENYLLANVIILFLIIISFGIYFWIKRNISLNHRNNKKDQKITFLENELEYRDNRISELSKKVQDLSMTHHKYKSKRETAEEMLQKLSYKITSSNNIEISQELSELMGTINEMSEAYSKEIASIVKDKKTLIKTNITGLDLLFEHFQNKAIKNNIDFELKVNCSINTMIEKFISLSDLEFLVGDHIEDAIISVTNNNSIKSICIVFDINDDAYELNIFDSGVPFEVGTLVKLGFEPITTYKDSGGSGFGFFNTFKILNKNKASLHIIELDFINSNFSKCIKFRFDSKTQYLINSPRSAEIKNADIEGRILFLHEVS